MSHRTLRRILVSLWAVGVVCAIGAYVRDPDVVHDALAAGTSGSFLAAAALYLVFGCLRGFTLIPSTTLVLAGVPFFAPWPLFGLTLAGILVSSASLYYFAEALHLEEVFAALHSARIERLRAALARHELPIIIGWSFFPLAPTDLIVYVCGVLRLNAIVCLAGVAIGEGAICGLYIFLGDHLLRALGLR